jgi:hypothetical protein
MKAKPKKRSSNKYNNNNNRKKSKIKVNKAWRFSHTKVTCLPTEHGRGLTGDRFAV